MKSKISLMLQECLFLGIFILPLFVILIFLIRKLEKIN